MENISFGENKNRMKWLDFSAFFLLFVCVIFLVVRAPYGFGHDDESFYLSIPFRLISGDSLLCDEWHLSQLSAFLMYIPVKLFMLFRGTTEGIILFFRYFYILMQTVCSSLIYLRFRKNGIASVVASVLFMLHTPLGIMTLSYNTIGLTVVCISGLLLSAYDKLNTFTYILVGVLVAFSVLCNPVLAVLFPAYTFVVIVYCVSKNNKVKKLPKKLFSARPWLFITVGIVIVTAIFVAFVLSRCSIKEIAENLPMLFTDPEYDFKSDTQNVFTLFNSVLSLIKVFPLGFILSVSVIIVILADKKRINHRKIYLVISAFSFIIYVMYLALPVNKIADIYTLYKYYYWMFPLSLFGFDCYLLSENKNKAVFMFLWILGMIYALCIDVSSDAAPLTSTMALAVSDTASIIFIGNIFNEINFKADDKSKTMRILASVMIVISVVSQLYLEITVNCDINRTSDEVMFMIPKQEINEKIEKGPLKGVVTTNDRAGIYSRTIEDLTLIKDKCKGNVLVCDNFAWTYLYLEKDYATYSTWCLSAQWFNGFSKRLNEYYSMHPDKMPDYAYVPYFSAEVTKYDYDNAKRVADDLISSYGGSFYKGKEGYIIKF